MGPVPKNTSNRGPRERKDLRAESDSIDRETSVRDAWALFAEEPVAVPQGMALRDIAGLLSRRRGVHTVAVVDEKERLVGIIPLRLIMDEMFFHIAPEEFLADLRKEEAMEEFGKISRADTVDELMQEPAYVTMDETVGDAYGCMHENRLEGLPIVDADMKPIGYVDRLQLLRALLQTRRGR
jgi:CBS domain-containing protein